MEKLMVQIAADKAQKEHQDAMMRMKVQADADKAEKVR